MGYGRLNHRQTKLRNKARFIDKKRRIKNKKQKYMIYYIFFAIVLISTTLILSLTVFFKIEQIEIENLLGKKKLNQEIATCLNVEKGDNLILVDSKKIIKRLLKKFPNLGNVEIIKKFPNQLKIVCDFEPAKFLIESLDGKFLGVSRSGRIVKNFVEQPNNLKNMLTISIKTKTFKPPKLGDFLKIAQQEQQILNPVQTALKNSGLNNITKIEIKPNLEIIITYNDKIEIEIDSISKIDKITSMAATIINQYVGANEEGTIKFFEHDKTMHFIPKFNYVLKTKNDHDGDDDGDDYDKNLEETLKKPHNNSANNDNDDDNETTD